jgi:hypothetical protein
LKDIETSFGGAGEVAMHANVLSSELRERKSVKRYV